MPGTCPYLSHELPLVRLRDRQSISTRVLGSMCASRSVQMLDKLMSDFPYIGARKMGPDKTTAHHTGYLVQVSRAYCSAAVLLLIALFDAILGVFLLLSVVVVVSGWDPDSIPISIYCVVGLGILVWVIAVLALGGFLAVVHCALGLAWWRGRRGGKPERFRR
jgi:hypothetical protein